MKKLIFAFVLMFGVMLASCGNSTNSVDTDKDVQVDSLDSVK